MGQRTADDADDSDDPDDYEEHLDGLFDREATSAQPTDFDALARLVRERPDECRRYVLAAATGSAQTVSGYCQAMWVAATLLDVCDDSDPWLVISKRARSLGLFVVENYACIASYCQCNVWVDAPEREAAKDLWLTGDRDLAYCDRCEKTELTALRRGEGFLVRGRKMAVALPGFPEGLSIDFGMDLICRNCFVKEGGTPKRLARNSELPGHRERDFRDLAYCYVPPPDRNIDGLLDELDRKALSLEQVLSWVKEQEARIKANAPAPQPAPGLPPHLEEWSRFAECLASAVDGAEKIRETDPRRALVHGRAILMVSRLLDASLHGLSLLSALNALFHKEKCWFEVTMGLDRMALAHLRIAKAKEESDRMRELHFATLRFLVEALINDKQYDEALERSLELFALAVQAQDEEVKQEARTTRGKIYLALGDNERGRDCFFTAGEFAEMSEGGRGKPREGPSVDRVFNDLNDAKAARATGRFEEAEVILTRLLETEVARTSPAAEAWVRSERGFTFADQGNRPAAIQDLNRAADLVEKGGPSLAYLVDAAAHWRTTSRLMAEPEDRKNLGDKAAAFAGDAKTPLIFRANQASLLCGQGRWAEARPILTELLAQSRLEREPQVEIGVRAMLAQAIVMEDQGDPDAEKTAIKHLRQAIRMAGSIGSTSRLVECCRALAALHFDAGRYPKAMLVIKMAMPILDNTIREQEDTDSRQQWIALSIDLFEMAVNINAFSKDVPLRLLWITEQVRARNLARWFRIDAAFRAPGGKPSEDEFVERNILEARAIEVELEERQLTGDLPAERMESLRSSRGWCRGYLDSHTAKSGREPFDWKAYFHKEPLRTLARQVESVLEPGSAILSLFSTRGGVCVQLLHRQERRLESENWFTNWPLEDRKHAAVGTARALAGDNGTAARSWGRHLVPATGPAAEAPDLGRLWSRLLEKIAMRLRDLKQVRRLIVLPHHELSLVPYWGLVDSCDALDDLVIAPSFEVFRYCLGRERPATEPALVIGDLTRTLTFADAEAALVRKVRGSTATVESARSYEEFRHLASGCSLLHVAGHGKFNAENPYESGIPIVSADEARSYFARYTPVSEFRPTPEPLAGSLRLLTVAACMSELRLDACRLAVLSTCESGIPRQHAGGELLGLPNAFLLAGAKSVVASLWRVHDAAAFLLMKFLYEAWKGGSGTEPSPARALTLARRRLRRTSRTEASALLKGDASIPPGEFPFADPVYADAFHCYGSW